ncbi:MAG TPA: hypothetical protein VFT13_10835, partial [Candidatus Krumholzibacteria bacterium]|nr:hypothetical protein [Candidatus Krumholzibacteria bacterium]
FVRRVLTLDAMRPDGVLAMPVDAAQALAPDPRKGAFHDVVALVAHLSGADPTASWPLLRVVMYPLAVLAFTAFASVFVGGAALAACLALFLLSYGGTAFRLVDASAYGQNLAAMWYWAVAAIVLRRDAPTRAGGIALAALSAGGVLVHLGVAVHLAVLGATLVAFAPAPGLARRDAWRVFSWLVLGAAAGVALRGGVGGPHANEIHAHVHGIMAVTERWFVMSPMEILRQHGMVFLGGLFLLPLAVFAAHRDAAARAALALSVIPVGVAFLPPVATVLFERVSYMAFRSILNAPVLPLAVLTLAWVARGARARGAMVRVGAALLLALWGVGFVAPSLRSFAADTGRLARPAGAGSTFGDLDAMVARLPVGATILSDPVTSYRLSATSSHRFVAVLQQHANPRDPWALERLAAVRDVVSPYAIPQAAVEACRRFGVDFVVLYGGPRDAAPHYLVPGAPELHHAAWDRLHSMPDSFREFARGRDYVVFRFDGDAVAVNSWSGITAPVVAAGGPAAACRVPVPESRFDVTGFAVTPSVASPGDTLEMTFGYRRDVESRYGPGVLFHVRFDHERVPARRTFPGEKYVRRMRERIGGTLFRFRADVRAGHGVYEPDLWPLGTPLAERFTVEIPPAAAPGVYRVEVRAIGETLLPNFALVDLLFNRDHYSGVHCATVHVHPRGAAP